MFGFQSICRGISRANERTSGGVVNWLMRSFQLDPQVYELRLMGVVSRAREGFFYELIPLNATSTWSTYVEMEVERGWSLRFLA